MTEYIRFQGAIPNRRGSYPGIFALVGGLQAGGVLTEAESAWIEETNARESARYKDPRSVDPDCYDRTKNPGARAWFLSDATDLLQLSQQYLEILDRHGIPWHELRTRTPGRITYADEVQVIAVPHTLDDWPLR